MDDIERMARKLRPLMPDRVARWLRGREHGDPELRSLIDQQIRQAAREVEAGNLGLPLLSLPSQRAVEGPITLGTVLYAGPRHSAGLKPSELLQNTTILGRSGSGKTNLVFSILTQVEAMGTPWLFLDVKRTARHLLPQLGRGVQLFTPGRALRPLTFNPFVPPPAIEPRIYAGLIIDALARAYTLGEGVISILQRLLAGEYQRGNLSPTPAALLARLDAEPVVGRAGGWIASARRALTALDLTLGPSAQGLNQNQLIRSLMEGRTIVELEALSDSARAFLVPMLCLWVYYQRLPQPDRQALRLLVALEEAHRFLPQGARRARESALEMFLRQCRELGIGSIVVDQHPALLSTAALGNSFATIALNLKDVPDTNRAAGILGLSEAEKPVLGNLPVGHAVVRLQGRHSRPFLVKIPHVPVAKGSVTDADLGRFLGAVGAGSGGGGRLSAPGPGIRQSWAGDKPLGDEALRLLEDVRAFPADGVRIRYRRLGISAHRGHRLKGGLVAAGWLETQVVPIGMTRKVVLRPTPSARSMLRLDAQRPGEGSIAHEYWRHFWRHRLEDEGYSVETEAAVGDGAADLLAHRGDHVVAVEVETGRSDVVGNVRRCLGAGLPHVLIVATSEHARDVVERCLADAGLLLAGRVYLTLRDQGEVPSPTDSHDGP